MRSWSRSAFGAALAVACAFCLAAAPGANSRAHTNEALRADVSSWTKKLNADFRDLNGTLHSNADALVDYVTKIARLYSLANRIQSDAAAARGDLEGDIATGADAQLAKRRALKGFDLLARSGAQWELYARCAAFGHALGTWAGCKTKGAYENFFEPDVFGTLKTEIQAALEQELQGEIKQGRELSHNAGTLLKLANSGLGNPLNASTTTKAVPANLPVWLASFSGDWSTVFNNKPSSDVYTSSLPGTFTFRQTGSTLCGRYDFSGGGTVKATVKIRTLTGESNDRDYGRSTFTMTLSQDGKTWTGHWARGTLSGRWKGTRVGPPSRSC